MEKKEYTLSSIEGEYAILSHGSEEVFIAMALLPFGADIGDRLIYSDGSFTYPEK